MSCQTQKKIETIHPVAHVRNQGRHPYLFLLPHLWPFRFKASARSATSVSKMYPERICFLLPPLPPPWSGPLSLLSGVCSSLPTRLSLTFPFSLQQQDMGNWTIYNWLRSFGWLCSRCKIKSKLPKRCRIYLSSLQSCRPPSSLLSTAKLLSLHGLCTPRHSCSFW